MHHILYLLHLISVETLHPFGFPIRRNLRKVYQIEQQNNYGMILNRSQNVDYLPNRRFVS